MLIFVCRCQGTGRFYRGPLRDARRCQRLHYITTYHTIYHFFKLYLTILVMDCTDFHSEPKTENETLSREDVNSDDEEDTFFKWRPRRYVNFSDSDSDGEDDVTLRPKCGDVIAKHNDEGYAMETAMTPDDVDVDALLNRPRRTFGRRRIGPLYEAPEFVQRLNAFEDADAGRTVTFECKYKALPKPTIKWYKDDEEVTESSRYVVEWAPEDCTVKLILLQVSKKDEGAYKCKAENQEGVASTTGYLSVKGDLTDKPLSSQPRKCKSEHTVSFPPHLRTIVEQQSVEEREAEAQAKQDQSPIQDFIDNFRREKTWPFTSMGYGPTDYKDADQESNSSDTSVESQDFDHVCFSANPDEDEIEVKENENLKKEDGTRKEKAMPHMDDTANHVIPVMNSEPRVPLHNQDISSTENTTSKTASLPTEYIINTLVPSGASTGAHGSNKLYVRPLVVNNEHTKTPPGEVRPTVSPDKKKAMVAERAPKRRVMDWSRALDALDTPCLYFLPVTTSAALFAAATQINPIYLVLFMVVVSLVGFRLVSRQKRAT